MRVHHGCDVRPLLPLTLLLCACTAGGTPSILLRRAHVDLEPNAIIRSFHERVLVPRHLEEMVDAVGSHRFAPCLDLPALWCMEFDVVEHFEDEEEEPLEVLHHLSIDELTLMPVQVWSQTQPAYR